MQVCRLFARFGKRPKIRREGDARQFPFEVIGVAFSISGMVKQPINIIEDVPVAELLPLLAKWGGVQDEEMWVNANSAPLKQQAESSEAV